MKKEKTSDILEELCDVLPATFRPHPGVCVVVQRGRHHVLLELNAILFTLVAVVVGHVEAAQKQGVRNQKTSMRTRRTL